MNSILIGLNSEFSNETSYDVYISTCDPTSWQLVFGGLSYENFPVSIGLSDYGVSQDCYQYQVSGNTGCVCIGTGTTNPCPEPSPSPTPSITVTPTPSFTPPVQPTGIPPTPSVTPSITTTVTPTITPSTSNNCKEYNFSCPPSPNTQVTEWQYVKCDGSVILSHNQNPGESATMCLRIGTLIKLYGPGTSFQLNNCSV